MCKCLSASLGDSCPSGVFLAFDRALRITSSIVTIDGGAPNYHGLGSRDYRKNAHDSAGSLAFFRFMVMPGAETGSTIDAVNAAGKGQSTGSCERL